MDTPIHTVTLKNGETFDVYYREHDGRWQMTHTEVKTLGWTVSDEALLLIMKGREADAMTGMKS